MATTFEQQMKALFNFDRLEKPVKAHLRNVYSCLAVSMLAATVGAYIHLFTNFVQFGFLTMILSLGLLGWLYGTPHTPENLTKRMGILGGFAFLTGMSLGPLMDRVIMIDPSIIPTAFLATSLVFICFSVSALLGNQRQWLYLGGTLMTGLMWLLVAGLANIFFQSRILFELNLYLGLLIMCGFVLYDTQLIVEKRRRGDDDFIWHSVDLFIDFVQLFRRIMVILANKEEKKRKD